MTPTSFPVLPIETLTSGLLEAGRLRPDFVGRLQQELDVARAEFPDMRFQPSTCELAATHPLHSIPQYTARPLNSGEFIFSCSQSPWDSTHVLANGDVVTCEVRDKIVMGNLQVKSLSEIWHGEDYRQFRRRYHQASDPLCRSCTYKLAYVPGLLRSAIRPAEGNGVELASGWHGSEGNVVWSKRLSRVVMALDSDSRVASAGVTRG